jgi:hypothetical protein
MDVYVYQILIIFVVDLRPDKSVVLGEVFVDGKNNNLWCDSKKMITDLNMYTSTMDLTDPFYFKRSSCVMLYYSLSKASIQVSISHTCTTPPYFSNIYEILCG